MAHLQQSIPILRNTGKINWGERSHCPLRNKHTHEVRENERIHLPESSVLVRGMPKRVGLCLKLA